jgi:hypothetical protein
MRRADTVLGSLDTLRVRPQSCTMMEMAFSAKDGKPERIRRAALGPVTHMAQTPPDAAEGHPCPCCLLSNSVEAFRDLIEGETFYGLRLFALRDRDGNPGADCRVNGDDWEKRASVARVWQHVARVRVRVPQAICGTTNPGAQLPGNRTTSLGALFCSRGASRTYRTVGAPENRGIEHRFNN